MLESAKNKERQGTGKVVDSIKNTDCPFDLLNPNRTLTQELSSINQRVRFFCRHGMQMSMEYALRFNQLLESKSIDDIEISVSDFSVGVYTPDHFDVTVRIWGMNYVVLTYETYLEEYEDTANKLKDPKGRTEVVSLFREYANLNPKEAHKINIFADMIESKKDLNENVPIILGSVRDLEKITSAHVKLFNRIQHDKK